MYITDTVTISVEAENFDALSGVYQLDYNLVDSGIVYDEASDNRAGKCSVSGYNH